MFRNRSDFEQCQNRVLPEKACSCDYIYSNNDLLTPSFIGMISGILMGLGIIKLWKYKYVGLEDPTKERICSYAWFRQKFRSTIKNMEVLRGYLFMYPIPLAFNFFAKNCIEESDGRIIKSSKIMFTFISTFLIAICFYPDFFNHNENTKVSVRLSALICFSGNILTLSHMPYEEVFETFDDYYIHVKKFDVIIYYLICLAVAILSFCFIPSEYTNPNARNEQQNLLEPTEVAVNSRNYLYRKYYNFKKFFRTLKGSLLLQAMFFFTANALSNIALDFICELFWPTKSQILQFIFVLLCFLFLFGAFFVLKGKLSFKDPIFMAVMVCNVDVFNRALYVAVFYCDNFSSSVADMVQFCFGIFASICGFIGLLCNQGQIVEKYQAINRSM